jgi:hypothetical protein
MVQLKLFKFKVAYPGKLHDKYLGVNSRLSVILGFGFFSKTSYYEHKN